MHISKSGSVHCNCEWAFVCERSCVCVHKQHAEFACRNALDWLRHCVRAHVCCAPPNFPVRYSYMCCRLVTPHSATHIPRALHARVVGAREKRASWPMPQYVRYASTCVVRTQQWHWKASWYTIYSSDVDDAS